MNKPKSLKKRIKHGRLKVVDLFCGGGGTSTGIKMACQKAGFGCDLTAINHWPRAVETHRSNHPEARHLCVNVDSIDPRSLYQEGELDILVASPECQHFSNARGGRPRSDQKRASAYCVIRWVSALLPGVVMVENVREFTHWGPLNAQGRVIKRKRGTIFAAWVKSLESFGYHVDWKLLRAADYGDPTTRTRFILLASRSGPITWPSLTHSRESSGGLKPWRVAQEIIDWTKPGTSVFRREKKLCDNTMKRILKGFEAHGLQPFILPQQQGGRDTHGIAEPMATITTRPGSAIVQPYLIKYYGTGVAKSIKEPLDTVTSKDRFGLVMPILEADGITCQVDFLFRLFFAHELAAAQGFPSEYQFAGNKEEKVAQIGNAVPVNMAEAIGRALITMLT